MLNIITGGAGCGKTFEMMDRIESAAKNGRNVLVIIPEQFSYEFDRILYERLGAERFNRIEVMSFTRAAREIFTLYGGVKGKYADDIVKNVVMFQCISGLASRGELGFYGRQAGQISFVENCLDVVKELTVSGIIPEELAKAAGNSGDGIKDKLSDISLIYTEYCRMLEEKGYKDGEGDISEAAKAAKNGWFRGKTIFVDAFKSFTVDEYAMLDVMLSDGESLTVCLTTEDRDTGSYSVFETVNRTIGRLKALAKKNNSGEISEISVDIPGKPNRFNAKELEFFSRNVLRNSREKYEGKCSAVNVYRSSDIYGEGDFVCSEIRRLVMPDENGFSYRYNDIAVVARQKETYSSVMESSFERYGIPFYTDESYTAGHKVLFIFVKTALRLAADENASSEEWLRYMKIGLLGLSDREIADVEDHCYKWSVDGKMWNDSFLRKEDEAEVNEFSESAAKEELGEEFPEAGGIPEAGEISEDKEKDEDLKERLAAEKVRLMVAEPIFRLRRECADADGRTICAEVFNLIESSGALDNLKKLHDECAADDTAVLTAVREVKQLWELLCTLLETLSRALSGTKLTLREFSEIFSSAVERLKLSSPPQTLDCVRFAAAHTARLSNVKVLFVIGANEGIFPYAAKSSGLLNDRDRRALEDIKIVLSGNSQDKLAEERFTAYSTVSSASDRLYISWAEADISGKALYPSVIAGQAVDMFGTAVESSFEKRGMLSFCTTPEAAYYQYVQNYRRGDEASASLHEALDRIPQFSSRLQYLKELELSGGHRLSPERGKRLFGNTISLSASRFEDYSKCPFMYFCKKGLKLYPPRRVEMDSPSRGTAIHECLSDFMRSFDKETFTKMPRRDIYANVKKSLDKYYRSSIVGGNYGKTSRYKAAFSRLASTVTDILARMAEEFRQSEFVPRGFEYSLRRGGSEEPLTLVTKSGIRIYFDGTIDRIDVFERDNKKYIRVVDYKSGIKDLKYIDLLYGINMQMLLYLFALTDADRKGAYRGEIPAGVLYMPASDAVPSLERSGGDKEKALDDTYKMKGVVLDDNDVIRAMEKECGGRFVPVKKTKDGYYSWSKLIKAEELESLKKYSYALLKETAESLHQGRIEASPLKAGSGSLPCEYCDYRTVCGEYPPRRVRVYAKDPKKLEEEIKKF